MDLTPEQVSAIEEALGDWERVDAAELPEPAARLAQLLEEILDAVPEES